MKLHCLGTAGYHPNETRQTSCYFLPEAGVVLDAGSGIFRLAPLIQTKTLDILLSHAHLDHIIGLTFLLDVLHQQPVDRLRIFGEAAKLAAIQKHLFHELLFPAPLDAQWIAIDQTPSFSVGATHPEATRAKGKVAAAASAIEAGVAGGGIQVTWRLQDHPGGSVGYRLDWPGRDKPDQNHSVQSQGGTHDQKEMNGTSIVYATDTTGDLTPEGIAWAEQPDLLIHECYFRDNSKEWALKTGHSWASRVASISQAVQPNKLLLSHINPLETSSDPVGAFEIEDQFVGELIVAEDGLVLDI